MRRQAKFLFSVLLVLSDAATAALAFYLAYWLRQVVAIPPAVNIAPFSE
jgi:hypothetical protein